MDPMISEDAAEVDTKAISLRQMAQNSLQIALLLWAWLQCWSGMFYHGFQICEGSESIKHIMPMVVLVVGLVMTNLIGFLHFRQKGLWRDACLAAVDLDTPYLAYRHGRQIVLGKTCPDWDLLRLRNSIWRSLPLAMVGFVLGFRITLEIPTCQAVGSLSTFAVGTFPELMPWSKFAVDLRENGVNLTELRRFQGVQQAVQEVRDEDKGQRGFKVGAKAIHLEHAVWAAAECKKSKWRTHDIAQFAEPQDWLMFQNELTKTPEAGIGSANLVAFDFMLCQYFKSRLLQEDIKRAVRPELERMVARRSTVMFGVSKLLSWEKIVEGVSGFTSDMLREGSVGMSVTSHRPWTVGSDTLHFELRDGWKIRLLQSFTLLLVAILPIRKKILQVCQITAPLPMALVTLHTSLDTVCLVTTWLLCAMASAAYFTGRCLELVVELSLPFAIQMLLRMKEDVSAEEFYRERPGLFMQYAVGHGEEILDLIHETMLPALAWNPYFFLLRAAGTLAFLAMSALLSRLLCPQRLAMCISVGVCGPLWLFTDEEEKEDTLEATAQGVCLLMIARNFFLASIVFFTWIFVNSNSIQLFFALICNRVLDVLSLKLYCLALFAANGLTGLLAALTIHDLRKNRKDGPSTLPAHVFLASSHGSAYGTFEARSQQSLAV